MPLRLSLQLFDVPFNSIRRYLLTNVCVDRRLTLNAQCVSHARTVIMIFQSKYVPIFATHGILTSS